MFVGVNVSPFRVRLILTEAMSSGTAVGALQTN